MYMRQVTYNNETFAQQQFESFNIHNNNKNWTTYTNNNKKSSGDCSVEVLSSFCHHILIRWQPLFFMLLSLYILCSLTILLRCKQTPHFCCRIPRIFTNSPAGYRNINAEQCHALVRIKRHTPIQSNKWREKVIIMIIHFLRQRSILRSCGMQMRVNFQTNTLANTRESISPQGELNLYCRQYEKSDACIWVTEIIYKSERSNAMSAAELEHEHEHTKCKLCLSAHI